MPGDLASRSIRSGAERRIAPTPPWGQTEFQVNLKLGLTSHACIKSPGHSQDGPSNHAPTRSVCTAAAVASLAQDSATLAGSMSRWPVWAATPERASDTTGCSRLARGPRLPVRPGLQVPLDCGQGGRAGSWCLGPRSVRTTLVMGGFPVRRGPPGRSEERNGRQGGSACRWPQVFHTQGIRLRPMTLFNPVFNRQTP